MSDLRKEASELSTQDLWLILEDQVDLYTEEELEIIREELKTRTVNNFELNKEERRRKEKLEEEQAERQRKDFEERVNRLKENGYEGYFEYKTLSVVDRYNGVLTTEKVTQLLNNYALDGWRLVSAYTNKVGQNSTSSGVGGFYIGINSTVEQHVLILERFVRI